MSEIENCQSCRDASKLTDDHQYHRGISFDATVKEKHCLLLGHFRTSCRICSDEGLAEALRVSLKVAGWSPDCDS